MNYQERMGKGIEPHTLINWDLLSFPLFYSYNIMFYAEPNLIVN